MKQRSRVLGVVAILLFALTFGFGTPAQADDALYLQTIGGLVGPYVYTSYAYIGATADAFAKAMYPASQVKTMMDEQVKMINHLLDMIQKVQATKIAENDRKFLGSMLEVLELLKSEAQSLSAFAVSKNPQDLEKYDQARKTVWPKIKNTLGIN
jgi:hypothetical protein